MPIRRSEAETGCTQYAWFARSVRSGPHQVKFYVCTGRVPMWIAKREMGDKSNLKHNLDIPEKGLLQGSISNPENICLLLTFPDAVPEDFAVSKEEAHLQHLPMCIYNRQSSCPLFQGPYRRTGPQMSLPLLRDSMLSPGQPPATVCLSFSLTSTPDFYSTNILLVSYRIHLSPGSRRNSVRITIPRQCPTSSRAPANTEYATRQHLGTPPVEQGHIYAHHSQLPGSTPPLTQATLSSASTPLHPVSGRVSTTSSPSTLYSLDTHHILPAVSSPETALPVSPPLNYDHRMIYQDQQPNSYGTFVNNSSQDKLHNTFPSSQLHSHCGGHSQLPSRSTSSTAAMPSRHSLSHINNPHYPSSHGPPSPSPTSVSSHTSACSDLLTLTYPISYASTHPYSHSHSAIVASQPAVHNNPVQTQSYLFQNTYTPNGVIAHSLRYSPPLTLAPIQDRCYTC
jgi:hypothetical protein